MNSNWFKIILKAEGIIFGRNLILKGIPVIYRKHGSQLSIGSDVIIKSSFLSNLVGLYSRTIIITRTKNARIRIGHDVGISGATLYAREGIFIGDGTLIGANSKILDNDFHPLDASARANDQVEKIGTRPISIGKNCFIGCNTLILKGTKLGNGCVVGAGAVVSGTFPDNSVIAGNPGKIIKTLTN